MSDIGQMLAAAKTRLATAKANLALEEGNVYVIDEEMHQDRLSYWGHERDAAQSEVNNYEAQLSDAQHSDT